MLYSKQKKEDYKNELKNYGSNFKALNHFVMNNTMDMCNEDDILSDNITKSVNKAYVCLENTIPDKQTNTPTTNIIMSGKRALEAAKSYIGKKTAVLDFANNHSIGGAPWSAGAQEESMCRCSTLYPCMKAMEKGFLPEKQG